MKLATSTSPMTVTSLESVVRDSELAQMDFYNDLMRPQRLWHGLVANVYRDQEHVVGLASYRTTSAGAYEANETAQLASLMPHLYRSIQAFVRLTSINALVRARTEIIDRLPQGIIVTDAAGRLGFTNSTADAIITEGDGLRIRNGVLQTSMLKETRQLTRLIAEAAGLPLENGRAVIKRTGAMQVSRPSMRQPLPLVVTPMRFGGSSLREPLPSRSR